MKQRLCAMTLSLCMAGLLTAAPCAQASLFGSRDSDPITPLQYSALLGLRAMDPELFRTKLLPLIDTAMKDGTITVGELKTIEDAAGNVAAAFYKAAKEPSLQESLNESMQKAQKEGKSLGDSFNDLNNNLSRLLDDAYTKFRNQLQDSPSTKDSSEPPTSL